MWLLLDSFGKGTCHQLALSASPGLSLTLTAAQQRDVLPRPANVPPAGLAWPCAVASGPPESSAPTRQTSDRQQTGREVGVKMGPRPYRAGGQERWLMFALSVVGPEDLPCREKHVLGQSSHKSSHSAGRVHRSSVASLYPSIPFDYCYHSRAPPPAERKHGCEQGRLVLDKASRSVVGTASNPSRVQHIPPARSPGWIADCINFSTPHPRDPDLEPNLISAADTIRFDLGLDSRAVCRIVKWSRSLLLSNSPL